ncbi:MAG: hypothetical protein ACHQT8_08200, partial [Chlamydiales bacterium]
MSGIAQILSSVGPRRIIFYDFLLCQGQLFVVSRRINRVCQDALSQRLTERIEMRDRTFSERTEAVARQLVRPGETMQDARRRLYDPVNARMLTLSVVAWGFMINFEREFALGYWWTRAQEINGECEADGAENQRQTQRCLIFLNEMHEVLAALPDVPPWDALPQLINRLRPFIAQENLAIQFKALLPPAPEPSPTTSRTFAALHQRHTDFARISGEGRLEFERTPQRLSLQSLRSNEEIAVHAEYARDTGLYQFWGDVRYRLEGLWRHHHLLEPFLAPDVGTPPNVIRAWINEPANREIIEGVEGIRTDRYSVFPPEIGRFSGLVQLTSIGREGRTLVHLPDELAQLNRLCILNMPNNAFREIPRVLERLPALEIVNLAGNTVPIRVLPAWFVQKMESGLLRKLLIGLSNEVDQ